MEVKFNPLLEVAHLLPLTPQRLAALPDIIDIRCGRIGLALYLYPVSSWHCGFNIQKQEVCFNILQPWVSRFCCDIILPTMLIECALF